MWLRAHRDDFDRLLIVVGIAIAWMGLGGQANAGRLLGVLTIIGLFVLPPLALLAAAALLWREWQWARFPLVAIGVLMAIAGALHAAADAPSVRDGLSVLAGVAISLGGSIVRVPADHRPVPAGRDPAAEPTRRPPPNRGIADDQLLLDFMDRASRLTLGELRALRSYRIAADPGQLSLARTVAGTAVATSGRERDLFEVRDELSTWTRSHVSPWTWEWGTMTDVDRGDVRRGAVSALLDAALAILAAGRISDPLRDVLLGPWIAVTERET